MKRIALIAAVIVGLAGAGVALATPKGISRYVLAKGTMEDVSIQAKGPVEISHRMTSWEPGGTTGWASWEGDLVVTTNKGEVTYLVVDDGECTKTAYPVGTSLVIPAGAVYQGLNTGEGVAEVHWTAFLAPGTGVNDETEPAGCPK